MAKAQAGFPRWTHTVSLMKEAGLQVSAGCATCKGWKRQIDLEAIIAAKGPDYSLINKQTPCPFTPGCKGYARFHYSGGVMRPLFTQARWEKWFLRGA